MTRPRPITRLLAALWLPFSFLWALMVAGFATARTILATAAGRPAPASGVLSVPFDLPGEGWASLKACLITLTPGTATLSIDMDRRELLVHVLDAADPDAVRQSLRRGPVRLVYLMAGEEMP